MPRIYTSASDPEDFCKRCFKAIGGEDEAYERFGLTACGEGPDGRGDCFGYNSDHPPYEWEDYRCRDCQEPLTEEDE
jgi:hypothetical protein